MNKDEASEYEFALSLTQELASVGAKLSAADRSLVLLCAGYIAGQAQRIRELIDEPQGKGVRLLC